MPEELLPCTLTSEEMAALAIELGKLQQGLDQLKATRKVLVAAIEKKSKIAVDGLEIRRVEVTWEMDYPNGMKRLIRQDTFNEVRSTILTPEERQQELKL